MILVVGSVNTDLVTVTPRIPGGGETLMAERFSVLPGGKGANQAVAAARLGARVALVGRIGDDTFGRDRRGALSAEGIDVSGLRETAGVASGVATILVEPSGENRILVVSGANARVLPEDVDPAVLAGAALVVLQLEIPIETVFFLIAAATVPVVLNPAPAVALDLQRLRGLAYLVPNRDELGVLSGMPTEGSDAVVAASRRLLRHGIGAVITTLAADGAMLVTRERVAHVAAPAVSVVDTTGAGDAFIGCFAASLVADDDVDAALARAVRYASCSVTMAGAQGSYLDAMAFSRF